MSSTVITISDVYKTYKLYQNKFDHIRDFCGWKTKHPITYFHALKNLNLEIKAGQKLALVGRNGSGKTTLLKMITGNFKPTSGRVQVWGKVQAIMNVGLGFHPEFSGYENIKASLTYNGLAKHEMQNALEEIIDFVELGEFIHQPVRTYSLGMQSRLSFATATAIRPEVLIIDEVLGAGDAYFNAKSAERMKKLTANGCTLLLVSHATTQVLQFCDEAIWLEGGEIVKCASALEVVRDYEAFTKKLEFEYFHTSAGQAEPVTQSKWLKEKILQEILHGAPISTATLAHEVESTGAEPTVTINEAHISRWPAHDDSLKITQLQVLSKDNKITNVVATGEKLTIEIAITAAQEATLLPVTFVILLFTEDGRWVTRLVSQEYQLEFTDTQQKVVRLVFDEVLLGAGKYVFSAAIYAYLDLNDLNNARYYDLLSRCFQFQVIGKHRNDPFLIYHPCRWEDEEKKRGGQEQLSAIHLINEGSTP